MPAFAEPLWLLGLAAVAVPIAIHLRGERAGRVVRVGSVRWLQGAPTAWAPAPRVRRIPLLLLRCAVLAALSLALARPYSTGPSSRSEPWVLVAPEVARRAPLDSLRRLGTVRLLVAGFPLIDDVRARPPDTPTDVWSLVREADAVAPAGINLVVVAPATIRFLRGERPNLRHRLEYHAFQPESIPRGTHRTGGPVTILAERGREEDARYLSAAFRAAAAARGVPEAVRVLPTTVQPRDTGTHWIAWLGGSEPTEAVRRRVAEGASLLTDGDTTTLTAGDRIVWRGTDGGPLLVVHRRGQGMHYRLRGRFHPSVLPAVLQPEFAEWVDTLWAPSPLRTSAPDLPISPAQRTPSLNTGPGAATVSPTTDPDLGRRTGVVLLLLATLLWLTERALVARERSA